MPVTIEVSQLGAELKRVRTERELSLRDVAQETGISLATLSRIERAAVTPELPIVKKLAKWLGVTVQASEYAGPTESAVRTDEDLKRVIAVHLRANKKLPEKVARAIIDSFDVVVRLESERAAKRKSRSDH